MLQFSTFIVERLLGSDVFLWNTLTKKKLLIPFDDWKAFKNGTLASESIFHSLLDGGFLVPNPSGERELYLASFHTNLSPDVGGHLSITFAPTLACNLACRYCFQNETKGRSEYRLEQLANRKKQYDAHIEFLEKYITRFQIQGAELGLYGGEPTLLLDDCLYFSDLFDELCTSKRVSVSKRITTNGALVSGDILSELSQRNYMVFITLDYCELFGTVTRPYHDGRGSFFQVLANIQAAVKQTQVNVNLVVSRELNVDQANRIADALEECRCENLYATISPEVPDHDNRELSGKSLVDKAQSRVLTEVLSTRGFNVKLGDESVCPMHQRHHFVFEPNGIASKCSARIGFAPYRINANIGNDQFEEILSENESVTKSWKEALSKQCLECEALPACGGGCFADNQNVHGTHIVETCRKDKVIDGKTGLLLLEYRQYELYDRLFDTSNIGGSHSEGPKLC